MDNVFKTNMDTGLNMEIEKFCSLFATLDQKEGKYECLFGSGENLIFKGNKDAIRSTLLTGSP